MLQQQQLYFLGLTRHTIRPVLAGTALV